MNCLACDKGPSVFDVRHNIAVNALYQLPFGKGKSYLNGGGTLDKIVGGWSVSGIGLYFHPGDAVMACFDDECEYWCRGNAGTQPHRPLRPNDPDSMRQAFAVIETLLRVLVLTVRITNIVEGSVNHTRDPVAP